MKINEKKMGQNERRQKKKTPLKQDFKINKIYFLCKPYAREQIK